MSVVSDSYDVYNMVGEIIGGELRSLVEGRSGVLVVRPDSGEPRVVVVKVLNILGDKFGHKMNSAGFKVLPRCVGVIQGDGISFDSLGPLLEAVEAAGWSTENIVFGRCSLLLTSLS